MLSSRRAALGLLCAASSASLASGKALAGADPIPTPENVAYRVAAELSTVPFTADLWSWSYGQAISNAALWDVSTTFPGQDHSALLNARLDGFLADPTSVAYKVLHNISMPWDKAIGDGIGLMPIAYLARAEYYGKAASDPDVQVALGIATRYVWGWPLRLPDNTISRDQGWGTQPDVNASFLWSDDQFMGVTLLARLARSTYVSAATAAQYSDFIAQQQVQFAGYMQNSATGLYYHGFNHADMTLSCCHWGRAKGWIMMAHYEVVKTLTAVAPNHPRLPAILAIWRLQASGLVAVQAAGDGRWHQVVNESSTFLETSATAMFLNSLADGVVGGWLDQATYDASIRAAWGGLASIVSFNGTVSGICTGTGVGENVAFYEARPTDYLKSSPGLGSVIRATLSYARYIAAFGS